MGQLAFVFAGQGDQHPGMGEELYTQYDAARRVFDLCDAVRPGTSAQCFHGTAEELRETRNTQPCLFAMELAGAAALMEQGVLPDAVAGFSLGEVTAATVSGVLDRETGFRVVIRRGELMQREAERYDTAMAAVVGLTADQVLAICARHPQVSAVNYNCPGQTSVAGLRDRMPDFIADVKASGGRAIPLKVAGAFHSPFMRTAAEELAQVLENVALHRPEIPLYSDLTAEPYTEPMADLLARQVCNPVQWERLIHNMIMNGVDRFIEIGPGRTLTGMIRRINGEVQAATLAEALAAGTSALHPQ